MEKIDFVLCWVDSNDPKWNEQRKLAHKKYFSDAPPNDAGEDNGEHRYREMGLLQYWFRSVEKFAPWVNKIYFITCGQKPEWLNEKHPKLVLVNHKDYIPKSYLPTFNSNPIELNVHRIQDLSEHFVLFNDDTFLLKPVSPEFYFANGLPILPCNLSICNYFGYNNWSFICFNDYCVINDSFNVNDAILSNKHKWFSIRDLGVKGCFKNFLCFKLNHTFSISGYEHIPQPHLKSTFQEVWERCPEIMNDTSKQAFRTRSHVNHWLICAWNQMQGKFHPGKPYSRGCHINISSQNIDEVCSIIKKQTHVQICLNDSEHNDNPELCFSEVKKTFDCLFPEKSCFEL